MPCQVCQNPKVMARNMCSKHYKRWYKGLPPETQDRKKAVLSKHHPVYIAWTNMKTRCDNINSTQYKWYGARGIHYSDAWKVFENFFSDMYPSWESGLMLDRIDNDKGYFKENCRWTTPKISANNRRLRGTSI